MASPSYIIIFFIILCVLKLVGTRLNGLKGLPGPWLASFSNLWKVIAVYRDEMHIKGAAIHDKYGPIVRIGPHHVSVSSSESFNKVHVSTRTAFEKVCTPVTQVSKSNDSSRF